MSAPHPRAVARRVERLRRLLDDLLEAYAEAHDAAYASYGGSGVRQLAPRGWVGDPTGQAAADRRRRGLRGSCRRASHQLAAAERAVERAAAALVDGWFTERRP